MNCETVVDIVREERGELEGLDKLTLLRHIRTCPDCKDRTPSEKRALVVCKIMLSLDQ